MFTHSMTTCGVSDLRAVFVENTFLFVKNVPQIFYYVVYRIITTKKPVWILNIFEIWRTRVLYRFPRTMWMHNYDDVITLLEAGQFEFGLEVCFFGFLRLISGHNRADVTAIDNH